MGGPPSGNRFLGHAEDDARPFVFGDRLGTRAAQGYHPVGTISAHPGEQHGDHLSVTDPGHRVKQHVDGRSLVLNRSCLGKVNPTPQALNSYLHVRVSRRHVGNAAFHYLALSRLD
ncbi:MAG: hypothetical protein QF681_18720, partial [Vicinamibacterales bacterium]|nr:hypothetical protein [Vicinamibacterales bacterium]